MPHNHLFLFVHVIFFPGSFFLQLHAQHLGVHLIVLLHLLLFSLLISTDPVEFFNLFLNFVKPLFCRLIFGDLPIGSCLSNDVINLCPAIRLFFVNDYQCFSSPIGSSCPTCSVDISVTIDRDPHLDDVSYIEIKSSCSHISSYQDITQS